ncbi:MAG: GntR family transcriptional regulator [Acutalibacteraceae bacterium]|nr:GntR family transcriptional regulator [Acutalibacteraceae bacterium]
MIDHKTVSLADQVYEKIESDILSGKYERGEILTELKLCEELGVSRTPVREALRRLVDEHIIEEGTRGCTVLGISRDDLRDIYEIRCEIEGLAAYKAAVRITDQEIEKLKELIDLQEFYSSKNDADHIKSVDNEFHYLIYRYSGSNALYTTLMPLHKKIQKYRKSSVENVSRSKESYEEHKAILDALIKRDGALAKEKMALHVKNAYKHIINKEN